MPKNYLTFSDLRAAYVPKDDAISLTSSDPELAESGFHLTLQKHTPAERLLRSKLEAAGLLRLPEGDFPKLVTYAGGEVKRFEPWHIFPLGVNRGKDWLGIDVLDSGHTWLAGETGSGKSVVVRTLLAHAAANIDRWQVHVVDFSKVELANYLAKESVLRESFTTSTSVQEALTKVEELHELVLRRYELLAELDAKDASELIESRRLKAQLLLIDEAYVLYGNMWDPRSARTEEAREELAMMHRLHEKLLEILRIGRAAGIFVVLATQRPDPQAYPSELRAQFTNRILLGRTDERKATLVLDWIPRELKDVPKGRGHVNLFGEKDEVQFYFSDFNTIRQAAMKGR